MRKTTVITFLALSLPLFGQTTIKDSLAKHWKTTGEFTLAVAKAMPAESYNFRPNPEEMSFGQLMAHIGVANVGVCALASGLPRPALPPKIAAWQKDSNKVDVDKDTAIAFLTDSFGFCNQALAAMTPDKLDALIGPQNRQMTGFEWLWAYFTHTAHHRGQAEVYLRVKGIKPPDYTF
ncbi:MAG: DinB family protein [Bryobacteraceae bacterium]|jgi:uncharacterized damage-inducible protein DinB